MHDWLLSMWELHDEEAKNDGDVSDAWNRFNVTVLPGWSYGRALALRADEDTKKRVRGLTMTSCMIADSLFQDHTASTSALKEAIFAFPTVVPLLADKIDVVLPGALRGHPDFRVHVDAR